MSREEEEREHLQKLIQLHRANLQHYEELEAKYGLDCPVYVKNAKKEARKGLAEARDRLAALEGRVPGTEPSIPAVHNSIMSELKGTKAALADILEAVAVVRQILESTGSAAGTDLAEDLATGTDLADDLTEALKGLACDLNRLRECHELRQHLRHLERYFSLCHDEVRRHENLMDIDLQIVQRLWDICKRTSLEKLVQFMESIAYIKWYSGVEDSKIIEIEKWVDDLRFMANIIDGNLRERRLRPLKESTSTFGDLVNKYSMAADLHLEYIIAKLCDEASQYMGRISQ